LKYADFVHEGWLLPFLTAFSVIMYWDWALLPLLAAILFVLLLLLLLTMMMIRFLDVIFGLEHTLIE
jgi:hypothetical protein